MHSINLGIVMVGGNADRESVEACVGNLMEPYRPAECDSYTVGGRWAAIFDGKDWKPIEELTEDDLEGCYAFYAEGYGRFGGEQYCPWKDKAFEWAERPPLKWIKETFFGHLAVVLDLHH